MTWDPLAPVQRRWRLPYPVRMWWQRLTRGYSDNEWYDLRSAAAQYILPRLKHLAEHGHGYHCTLPMVDMCDPTEAETAANMQAWAAILADVVYAMEYLANEEAFADTVVDEARVQRGCELLGRWFQALWD